jgi:hypothetical protein
MVGNSGLEVVGLDTARHGEVLALVLELHHQFLEGAVELRALPARTA